MADKAEETTAPAVPAPPANGPDDGPGFPGETPLADMTAEQQAAYWKFHARHHEDAEKAAKAEAARLGREAEELRRAQMTEQEKALQQARDEARREGENLGASQWQRVAAEEAVVGVARAAGLYGTDEQRQAVADLIGVLDLSALVTADGKLDRARIEKTLGVLAPKDDQPARGSGHAARADRLQPGGGGAGSVQAAKQAFLDAHKK